MDQHVFVVVEPSNMPASAAGVSLQLRKFHELNDGHLSQLIAASMLRIKRR
jgi:hypothetical protein